MFTNKKRGVTLVVTPVCGVLVGVVVAAGIGMLLMKKRCALLTMTEGIMDAVMGKRKPTECCDGE